MTTYNGEKYLVPQLDSILHQFCPPDELVICDDGSSDRTISILAEYERAYPSVLRIYVNRDRLGYVKNFGRAIALCTGDIIALSDQDDVWNRFKLHRVREAFTSNPGCSLVFSDAELIDSLGNRLSRNFYTERLVSDLIEGPLSAWYQNRVRIKGCTLVFRAADRPHYSPYGGIGWGHDNWLFFLAPLVGDITYLDEPLIQHRRHSMNSGNDPSRRNAAWRMRRRIMHLSLQTYERNLEKWLVMLAHLEELQRSDSGTIDRDRLSLAASLVRERAAFAEQRLRLREKGRIGRTLPALSLFLEKKYGKFERGAITLLRDLVA